MSEEKKEITAEEAAPFLEKYKKLSEEYGLDFGAYLDYQPNAAVARMSIIRTKKSDA
ncbi:MAG: hypothetical protein KGJ90_04200 [Patescibacteria group bacterium]|nr:hypothetical protein [Patescibacteria group bacterium]